MTIPTPDLLANLGVALGTLVAPALGESYPGKSAATVAGILLMLAEDLRGAAGRREAAFRGLSAILATATMPDPAFRADIRRLLAGAGEIDPEDRMERLLLAFIKVHEWADRSDPELARQCRDFLVALTAGEILVPPAAPAG